MSDAGGGLMGLVRQVTPDAIRERFALKFFMALLFICLLVGAAGLVATDQIHDEFQQQVRSEHANQAGQQAESLAAWNERNRQFVLTLANARSATQGDRVAIQSYFDFLMDGRGMGDSDQSNLHYVNLAAENVPASTRQTYTNESITVLNESVREALDTPRVAVSEPYTVEELNGERTARIAYVAAVPGRSTAVVYSARLTQFTEQLSRSDDSATFAVDGNGTVLASESSDALLADYGGGEALATARGAGGNTSGVLRTDISGGVVGDATGDGEYVVGYSQVEGTDWVVLQHTHAETAYGTVRDVTQYGQIATLIGVLAIAAIGAVLGRNTARSLNRLRGKAEAMQEGDLDVEIESPRIDTVGRLYDGFAAMRDSLKNQINEAERARKEAEVARAEAVETNEYLQEKATEYSEVMEAAATGDLTRRMEIDEQNEAMDSIATDFNEMIAELEKTVGQLDTFADQVEESGHTVGESAESVREAAEQIADSIQAISDAAYQRRDEIEGAADAVEAAIEALDAGDAATASDRLDEVVADLESIAEGTDDTMAEAETVAGAAEEQAAELNEVSRQAEELVRYVKPLSGVIGNFETDAEHEFVFATGAGGPAAAEEDDD